VKQQEREGRPAGFAQGRVFAGDAARLPAGARVAVVVSRYNAAVTERMLDGAARTLAAAGLDRSRLDVARVPGAFELPLAADRLAATGTYSAVICLGAIIRGETTHDQHIAAAVAAGIEQVGRSRGIPVLFGVLTCQSIEQAVARAGGDDTVAAHSNKGEECAEAAIEMIALFGQIASASGEKTR
jgi:6,7-dimethyl-8-ribityllumazine synthase